MQAAGGVFNVIQGDKERWTPSSSIRHQGSLVCRVHAGREARLLDGGGARQARPGARRREESRGRDADADLDFAEAIAGAAHGSAGERCMAISAVVAVGASADPLIARLAAKAGALTVGPGTATVDMGPLVTREHRDRVAGYIDAGVEEGARLVCDGRGITVAGHDAGFFLGPTLFDAVTPAMRIYRDEIFGPVLVVVRVETLDEAIALVNRNPDGNGTELFTSSGRAAQRFQDEIEIGMVGINVPIPVPTAFFRSAAGSSRCSATAVHGMEGSALHADKAITSRWPGDAAGPPARTCPSWASCRSSQNPSRHLCHHDKDQQTSIASLCAISRQFPEKAPPACAGICQKSDGFAAFFIGVTVVSVADVDAPGQIRQNRRAPAVA
jgi:malonate-semialdehyde dehydrogenase (acetylating)/methylmalonate-semialdehyde dehydrogenase